MTEFLLKIIVCLIYIKLTYNLKEIILMTRNEPDVKLTNFILNMAIICSIPILYIDIYAIFPFIWKGMVFKDLFEINTLEFSGPRNTMDISYIIASDAPNVPNVSNASNIPDISNAPNVFNTSNFRPLPNVVFVDHSLPLLGDEPLRIDKNIVYPHKIDCVNVPANASAVKISVINKLSYCFNNTQYFTCRTTMCTPEEINYLQRVCSDPEISRLYTYARGYIASPQFIAHVVNHPN